jgi:photosystem II stability/assembly factor-like uncharacterized protein
VDPSNPDVIYAALDSGGIRKSLDGGRSWTAMNVGLREVSDSMEAVIVSPYTSQVVFATARGAGRAAASGGYIFKSRDAGATWTLQWQRPMPISTLAFAPSDPQILYAASGDRRMFVGRAAQMVYRAGMGEFYQSVDGGEHWRRVSVIHERAHILSIAVSPHNAQTVFVTTEYGVYKSTDGGAHWTLKTQGLPHQNTRKVLIDPSDPRVLYLTLDTFPQPAASVAAVWQGGVYKSLDGGESWIAKNAGLPQTVAFTPTFRQTSTYWDMALHPENPRVLYVCDHSAQGGIYRTDNGGDTWTPIVHKDHNVRFGWLTRFPLFRAANIALARTKPHRLFFSTPHGGQIFGSDDGGAHWQQLYTQELEPGKWQGRGIELMGGTAIATDPHDAKKLYVGYGDWGVFKSDDGGKSFVYALKAEDVNTIVIDPDAPNVLYVATGFSHTREGPMPGTLYKSVDGGVNWTIIGGSKRAVNGLPPGFLVTLLIDPRSPVERRTLYVTNYGHGIYKSVDGGKQWRSMSRGLEKLEVRCLIMERQNPRVLYAGIDKGGIFKSIDAGEEWQRLSTALDRFEISALAHSLRAPRVILAGVRSNNRTGAIYMSRDGGVTWRLTLDTTAITDVAVSTTEERTIYAASYGGGLYRSEDDGETWASFNAGLPSVYLNTVVADGFGRVYIGMKGNGIVERAN